MEIKSLVNVSSFILFVPRVKEIYILWCRGLIIRKLFCYLVFVGPAVQSQRQPSQRARRLKSSTFYWYWIEADCVAPSFGYALSNDDQKIGQALFIYVNQSAFRDLPSALFHTDTKWPVFSTVSDRRISLAPMDELLYRC